MSWTVVFYSPKVEKALLSWPKALQAKLLRILDLIRQEGANLGMPLTRAMGDGLFEIRAKAKEGIGRVFFCYVKKNEIIILHSFIKKMEVTPKHELDVARKRLQEVLRDEL